MTKWIALIDMNSFFASVEQLDFSEYRGQPVVVTNGLRGATVITASYEARAFGIKTGTSISDAISMCPHLIQRRARHQRYQEISDLLWDSIRRFVCPDIEVSSIDEAYIDFSHCQYLYPSAQDIANIIQKVIQQHCPIPFSMGISSNKRMAKYAANFRKPNGITIIPQAHIESWLATAPIADICGIGDSMQRFFQSHGVYFCHQIKKIPLHILARKWGIRGKEIWFFAQGKAFEKIQSQPEAPKSISHSKVLPSQTYSADLILAVIQTLCEKVAYRLRENHMITQKITLLLKASIGLYKVSRSVPYNENTASFFLI